MITVFTKDNCVACKMTKNVLNDLGIDFMEINVDEDLDAFNYLITKNLRTLPIVEHNNELVAMGFQPQNLKKLKK